MLVSMKKLMQHALDNKYAVGYFEAWNMDAMLAVINAAERENSPIIIGFSGMFLGNSERIVEENIYHYGAIAVEAARQAKVPCAVLFNESKRMDILIKGLKAGFNAVMYQNPGESYEDTVRLTKYLCETAHFVGADVESEVGELPNSDISTNTLSGGEPTDPEKAISFIKETGIDALAIACGNVHLLEGQKSELDFELIKAIRSKVNIPIVLHGGTGISKENLKKAIELGIAKVNVGTVMKRVYINAIREYLNTHNVDIIDPHEVVGKGGELDMLCIAREAVTENVRDFIKTFGSSNKASMI